MFAATAMTAIADDTGLEVDALDGAPGRVLRSLRGRGRDLRRQRAEAPARRSSGVPVERRTARFATVVHVAARAAASVTVRGEVAGTIAESPRGAGTFGYDPVFVPDDGDGRTFAEMAPSEKHALSHRGRAFRALVDAFGACPTIVKE